jgi:UDP-N-acetylglucosamine--dolichyl-phosphate N-acetylglucosaminephosphotransferase
MATTLPWNFFTENHEITCSIILSTIVAFLTYLVIPSFFPALLNAGLKGKDLGKLKKPVIPEAVGVICGMAYLVTLTLFVPIEFDVISQWLVSYLGGLLAICWMILLGFLDDVLNLKWRHKLWIPTVASLPLLIVHYMYIERTIVVLPPMPGFFENIVVQIVSNFIPGFVYSNTVDLGLLFYIYIGMLAVFCTNSINIYAGINGLEVGQSLVIAGSIITFNLAHLNVAKVSAYMHLSLHFMIPFFMISLVLFSYNKYPAKVFVGDTFCYFAGMTFAVVGIIGHMSKTLLLFFIPQIFNFLFSVPQLFKIVNCPRHRLPKLNTETGLMENSYTDKFKLSGGGLRGVLRKIIVTVFRVTGLIKVREVGEDMVECTNFTLINLALIWLGPTSEKNLARFLIVLQIVASLLAFGIRSDGYGLAGLIYQN